MTYGPWLTLPEWDTYTWRDDMYKRWSCITILRHYFKFPQQVQKIRFYVTTRSRKEAYEITIANVHQIKINNKKVHLYGQLYCFLKQAAEDTDKKVYFGLEYV